MKLNEDQINFPLAEKNSAAIFGQGSADNFHQGRFAGTILTQKNMHFARLQVEIDLVKGVHPGKAFVDGFRS